MIAIAVLFLAAAAQALPLPQQQPATSFTHPGRSFYQDHAGQYVASERTEHGVTSQDRGVLRNALDGTQVLVREGNWQYISPEGMPVIVTYTADETGFHAYGNVVPGNPEPRHIGSHTR